MILEKGRRSVMMLLIMWLFLIGTSTVAMAQELPKGMVIGDDKGISAKANGEYFVKVDDVMPGKKWHTTVSIVNMEKDVPYQLNMLISPPTVSGSLDLSKVIRMTLTYNGTVVYDGPASGVSDTKSLQSQPLDLGVFQAGDSRALEVDYSLSGKYTNEDFVKKNVMDNVWTFYAVKTNILPDSSTTPPTNAAIKPFGKFPSTGEEIRQSMLFICIGLFLLLIVLLIWKAQRKKENQHDPMIKK